MKFPDSRRFSRSRKGHRSVALLAALAFALPSPAAASPELGRRTLRGQGGESPETRAGLEEALSPQAPEPEEEKRESVEALRELIRNVSAILEAERLRGAGQLKPRIEQIRSDHLFTEHHVTYVPALRGRLKVIGDLHGDLESLEQALAQAGYDPSRNAGLPPDQQVWLAFVGDYADVGRMSLEAVVRVLQLKAMDPEHVILKGGNHDRDRPPHVSANVQMHSIRRFFKELEEVLGPAEGDQLYGEFHRLMTGLPVLAVFPNGIVIGHAEGPSLAEPPAEYPEKFRARYDPELGLLNFANPLIVDQVGWNLVRRPAEGQPEAEEDQIVDGAKYPRIDPETMQPGYWIGRKSHFGFLSSIGGKVFLRGHDRLGPPDQVLFDGTFLTVITTDYRSPHHGYDPKEKITGRYAEFDLARAYDRIDPDEVVRYLLWPPTGQGVATHYLELMRQDPAGISPRPMGREKQEFVFRTVDGLVRFYVGRGYIGILSSRGDKMESLEVTEAPGPGRGRILSVAELKPPGHRQDPSSSAPNLWARYSQGARSPLIYRIRYDPKGRTLELTVEPDVVKEPGQPDRARMFQTVAESVLPSAKQGTPLTVILRPGAEGAAPAGEGEEKEQMPALELDSVFAQLKEAAQARDWAALSNLMLDPERVGHPRVRILQSAALAVAAAPGPERWDGEALLRFALLFVARNRSDLRSYAAAFPGQFLRFLEGEPAEAVPIPPELRRALGENFQPVLRELLPAPVPPGLLRAARSGNRAAEWNLAAIGTELITRLADSAELPLELAPTQGILGFVLDAFRHGPQARFWNARILRAGEWVPFLSTAAFSGPAAELEGFLQRQEAAVRAHQRNLKEEDEDLRVLAADGLGSLGPDSEVAVPDLIRALEDSSTDVRRAAGRALGSVGFASRPAEGKLTLVAQADPDAGVREAAQWSLSILAFAGPTTAGLEEGSLKVGRVTSFEEALQGLRSRGRSPVSALLWVRKSLYPMNPELAVNGEAVVREMATFLPQAVTSEIETLSLTLWEMTAHEEFIGPMKRLVLPALRKHLRSPPGRYESDRTRTRLKQIRAFLTGPASKLNAPAAVASAKAVAETRIRKVLLETVTRQLKPEAYVGIGSAEAGRFAGQLSLLLAYAPRELRGRLFMLTERSEEGKILAEQFRRMEVLASYRPEVLAGGLREIFGERKMSLDFYAGAGEHRTLQAQLRSAGSQVTLRRRNSRAELEGFLTQLFASLTKAGLEEIRSRVDIQQLAADLSLLLQV